MKRRRGRRELSEGERQLWQQVAQTVSPLPGKAAEPAAPPKAPASRPGPAPPRGQLREDPVPAPPRRSPFDAGDPRRERKVARGRIPIEAVLDLHGMRQVEADRATLAFLTRSVRRGHRVVLVITGKGSAESGDGRGVLRKRFLQGVEAGLYGREVVSVRPAHQRHGGAGAFYIFLKGQRRSAVTKPSSSVSKRP